MAVRIPVVVTQSARRDGRSIDLEESLITRLMLAPGLDATLVASLDAIQHGSTDHLCLQDLGREVILAGWLPLESAASVWKRLELDGHLVPFGFSSQLGSTAIDGPVRRIRYLQLTHQASVDEIVHQLEEILASRRVQTIAIQPLSGLKPHVVKTAAPNQPTPPTVKPSSQQSSGSTQIAANEKARNLEKDYPIEELKPDRAEPCAPPKHHSPPSEWQDLDQLVDDLDALDL